MVVKRSGNLSGKLRRLTSDMERELVKAVERIAGYVKVDAQISITTGATSAKGQHRPSAPGTPPNNMSGHLADNIEIDVITPLHRNVVSKAEYGAIQELGGTIDHPGGTPFFIKDGELVFVGKDSPAAARLPKTKPHLITLPERPYMRPAAKKNHGPGIQRFERAVDKVLKGGKL